MIYPPLLFKKILRNDYRAIYSQFTINISDVLKKKSKWRPFAGPTMLLSVTKEKECRFHFL